MTRSLITLWIVTLVACIAVTVSISWVESLEWLLAGTLLMCVFLTVSIMVTLHKVLQFMSNKQGRHNANRS